MGVPPLWKPPWLSASVTSPCNSQGAVLWMRCRPSPWRIPPIQMQPAKWNPRMRATWAWKNNCWWFHLKETNINKALCFIKKNDLGNNTWIHALIFQFDVRRNSVEFYFHSPLVFIFGGLWTWAISGRFRTWVTYMENPGYDSKWFQMTEMA